VLDAENRLSSPHLVAADLSHVAQDVGVVLQLGVEDVAAFSAGAGHDHHLLALADVLGQGRRALARLVVGVCVHRQQPEPSGLHDHPPPLWRPVRAVLRRVLR
jgi:hypothetical protein